MDELSTHERLYLAVRRRMGEARPWPWPADRIAPLQIADENRVSVTPVREALFRLVGERLVTLHPDGGFARPTLESTVLADLHAWNGHHLLAALHLLPDRVVVGLVAAAGGSLPRTHVEVVDRLEALFASIGGATGNAEFVVQIEAANHRLRRARLAEERLFPDTARELGSIVRRVVSDAKANVRRRVHAYHRRRVEHAGQIAGLLASTPDGTT